MTPDFQEWLGEFSSELSQLPGLPANNPPGVCRRFLFMDGFALALPAHFLAQNH
jgi:hypothetical protein